MKIVESACEECDLLLPSAFVSSGSKLVCPRCGHTISDVASSPLSYPIAFALTSVIMLALTYAFPFMSFSSSGNTTTIYFYQAMSSLVANDFLSIAAFLLISLTLLPLLWLLLVLYVHIALYFDKAQLSFWHLRILQLIKPWMMVDVFLVGILVALVKIMSLAEVGFGLSFWAFVLFTLSFLKTLISVDLHWLWIKLAGPLPPYEVPDNAHSCAQVKLTHCHFCNAINPLGKHHCCRCQSKIVHHTRHKTTHCIAFLIAAIVFYVPANLFPMMDMQFLGQSEPSTIMGGVILLWQIKSYPVALVIFFASVMIPISKMVAIGWLCYTCQRNRPEDAKQQLKIYRITELIGRWSMIDVFVVAVLVALVHLEGLVTVYPGQAAVSFAAVVVLTMLSAMSFDPRIIWDPSPQSEQTS
ncbi:paraquat-inducible protein A [Motilimonas eburnea]|uniref:paraquat-inducible protein A n=1 Tax=Motilimonas eburnea TaxID=1737488 RepID=UPI001E48D6DE|nr:paraquat-inducible protein A [Motilimonas eburnea]MCE2573690.1 paraquat-inducible protein A [Motilimonas eburnea]